MWSIYGANDCRQLFLNIKKHFGLRRFKQIKKIRFFLFSSLESPKWNEIFYSTPKYTRYSQYFFNDMLTGIRAL